MPLFNSIDDLKGHFPYLASANWEMVKPFLELTENDVLYDKVLGPTLFAALQADYTASIATVPVALPTRMADLLYRVRPALAFLTAYEASPTLNVFHSSGGMMVTETDKQKPAHMWRVNAARNAMLKQAYGNLNQLIGFLLRQKADYPEWTDAPVYVEVNESLIPEMRTADRYVKLAGPWLLHHLRPALRAVQVGPVCGILGTTAYDTLLANVQAGTPTADEQKQLEQIRPAMLHTALAEQVIAMALTIDQDGVWNWESVSSSSAVSGGKQPASDNRLTGLVRHHEVKGKAHLEALRQLVNPATGPSLGYDSTSDGSVFFTG